MLRRSRLDTARMQRNAHQTLFRVVLAHVLTQAIESEFRAVVRHWTVARHMARRRADIYDEPTFALVVEHDWDELLHSVHWA